jgi:hypothetical protein
MKGFMGGFELHQLQQRMQAGRLNRARRGEWLGQPPAGYVIGDDGKLKFDPDEQVAHRIGLILKQFAIQGSVSGVLRYLKQHRMEVPFRAASGPDRGQLQWRAPQRNTLRQFVRNPAYAGAYTWGRRGTDPRRVQPGRRGSGRRERAAEECQVFIQDNHPPYISWEQYQSNIRRLQQHRRRGPVPGPARTTVSLLAGLVVCGQCGCRMQTRYTRSLRYDCQRRAMDHAGPPCQSLAGASLEQLVSAQVLEVVTPASLELSTRAAAECERERATLDRHWKLRLQRAAEDASRAFRQYNAVDPEHRLVAHALERGWEDALLAQRTLEEEYHRFQRTQPTRLSAAERALIERLAHDLPALWQAPQTSVTEKRQVMRILLERAVVWAPASTQEVKVQLHWTGGTVTEHHVTRPVSSWKQMAGATELWQRVRQWKELGWSSTRMADELNRAGYRTPRGQSFTAESVRQLMARSHPRPAGAKGKGRRKRRTSGKAP